MRPRHCHSRKFRQVKDSRGEGGIRASAREDCRRRKALHPAAYATEQVIVDAAMMHRRRYDGYRAWATALIGVLRRELPPRAASQDSEPATWTPWTSGTP